ncbi:AraC family transcriptional regulator [Terrimonas sp. NA20]|uniref:AraC family transcriptional regulator n=1 Tax=Terrimonas ginsenosidimutans TaxID=2908004 RepID=A0ABS9KMG0_9BACT|nr:AraC family transcriptional regulator [Terrimonas ginsenosidimutans]MCG2613494.1 AraC family transcriptional regulator [Terrimonas ginsenosidimutans]
MVYFNNPGHIKKFSIDILEDLHYITMSEGFLKENVHPDIFNGFSFLLCETTNPKIVSEEQFNEFEDIYRQLYKAFQSDSPYRNKLIGHLFVAILIKIKEYVWKDSVDIKEIGRTSEIVREFKILMEKHYRELSMGTLEKANRVQEYADQLFLHPNYLNSVIKNATGKSVGNWITEKTITEAKSLLRNSDIPLKEISYRLGFMEPQNFSTFFKKHTQRTPLMFRQGSL